MTGLWILTYRRQPIEALSHVELLKAYRALAATLEREQQWAKDVVEMDRLLQQKSV